MSFDDLHSSLVRDGRPATTAVDIEFDVKLLESRVAECEEVPVDDAELSSLLARLDGVDSVASGVEAKLDGILGTLDDLLTSLEPGHVDKPREAAMPCSESESKRPLPPKQ